MISLARISSTTALVTLMAAPVCADVSADDVWDAFTSYYQGVGLKVEANQTRSGNRLDISDLKISAVFPFELGSIAITTTGFGLIEIGDGTVEMALPDNLPLAMALSLPEDIYVTATIDYQVTGYHAVASGDPHNITIKSEMDSLAMELADVNITAAAVADQEFDFKFRGLMRGSISESTYSRTDMLIMTQGFSYDSLQIEATFSGLKAGNDEVVSTASMLINGAKSNSRLAIPAAGIDLLNLPAQLREGLSLGFTSEMQTQHSTQQVTAGDNMISDQTTTVENSNTSLAFSKSGITIKATTGAYSIDMLMPEVPFPIKAAFSSVGAELSLPLLKSDTDQGFVYMLDLNGIQIDDGIWNQFDPDAVLPRDSAKFLLDITGKGRLYHDLLDFDAVTQVFDEGIKFGELTALTLNDMNITAIGARLTGNGAFTFDNSDHETYGGMPAPTGSAHFFMTGLNGVLDGLVNLGLMKNDEVFAMRMGMGMFAVAGDSDDTLVSDIEVLPDGQIMANGKRIR